jgi:hypothetical protein
MAHLKKFEQQLRGVRDGAAGMSHEDLEALRKCIADLPNGDVHAHRIGALISGEHDTREPAIWFDELIDQLVRWQS